MGQEMTKRDRFCAGKMNGLSPCKSFFFQCRQWSFKKKFLMRQVSILLRRQLCYSAEEGKRIVACSLTGHCSSCVLGV